MITIKTDHKWKNFRYGIEVPEKIMADQFGHLSDEDGDETYDGFIRYRHRWYHISDFMASTAIPGFAGVYNDSFYSGIAIRLSEDGEQYQIATVIT